MSRLLKSKFLFNFEKHVKYVKLYNIPLSPKMMIEAVERGDCPFNCKQCEEGSVCRLCVLLRDKPSYAPNAIYFRRRLSKRTVGQLTEIIKYEFGLG